MEKTQPKTLRHNLETLEKIMLDSDTWGEAIFELEHIKKELLQLDVFKWLEENHPLGKQCFSKEARLIDTIVKFRDQVLGGRVGGGTK